MDVRLFYRTRKRRNEELKSKSRIKRERQRGKEVKRAISLAKYPLKVLAFGRGVLTSSFLCSHSQVCRARLSLYELNKGTLVYSQAKGTGAGSSEAGYYIWL